MDPSLPALRLAFALPLGALMACAPSAYATKTTIRVETRGFSEPPPAVYVADQGLVVEETSTWGGPLDEFVDPPSVGATAGWRSSGWDSGWDSNAWGSDYRCAGGCSSTVVYVDGRPRGHERAARPARPVRPARPAVRAARPQRLYGSRRLGVVPNRARVAHPATSGTTVHVEAPPAHASTTVRVEAPRPEPRAPRGPGVARGVGRDGRRPNIRQPHASQPNIQQPYASQPNIQQPHASQPNIRHPRAPQPSIQQPNIRQPHAPQPNIRQPRAARAGRGRVPGVDAPGVRTRPSQPRGNPAAERAQTRAGAAVSPRRPVPQAARPSVRATQTRGRVPRGAQAPSRRWAREDERDARRDRRRR